MKKLSGNLYSASDPAPEQEHNQTMEELDQMDDLIDRFIVSESKNRTEQVMKMQLRLFENICCRISELAEAVESLEHTLSEVQDNTESLANSLHGIDENINLVVRQDTFGDCYVNVGTH